MDERSERIRDVAQAGNASICAFTARLIEVLHISGSGRHFYHFRIMTELGVKKLGCLAKGTLWWRNLADTFGSLKEWNVIVLSCGQVKGFEGFGGLQCMCTNENELLSPLGTRTLLAVPYFVQVKLCCQTARIAYISRSRGCV